MAFERINVSGGELDADVVNRIQGNISSAMRELDARIADLARPSFSVVDDFPSSGVDGDYIIFSRDRVIGNMRIAKRDIFHRRNGYWVRVLS